VRERNGLPRDLNDMKILAISGSAREASTNTILLAALRSRAPAGMAVSVFHRLDTLPVFSPDAQGERTPAEVNAFLDQVSAADGIVVASPEYVRAIPGGLKNAIDWMVARFEIVGKPIALAHASHRGDDMLASLRLVLSTVSDRFLADVFLRISLMGKSPEDAAAWLRLPEHDARMADFLAALAAEIRRGE
jgi:chromate reductase, NAD(P)H dehydrogenase (quinone)